MDLGNFIRSDVNLFENQKNAVRKLVQRKRCILSDKCGGGKTLSVLYGFSYLKSRTQINNLLVLTPLSAYEKQVWKKDIEKFTKLRCITLEELYKVVTERGSIDAERLEKALGYYSVIYGKHTHVKSGELRRFMCLLNGRVSTLLCVDEVHIFRNPKSELTSRLREVVKCGTTFWAITATTISRNIENLYNIINLVSPWYLGTWSHFRDTYCNASLKTVGYDRVKRKQLQVYEVKGLKDPIGLQIKLEPLFITGESFALVKYHYIDYELDVYEQGIYRKIANGISLSPENQSESWLSEVLSKDCVSYSGRSIGNVEDYSSRFVYLQYASDGIIGEGALYNRFQSTKLGLLLDCIKSIVRKGQSCLVYCEYLLLVHIIERCIKDLGLECDILQSTGENRLKEGLLTEASCKRRSKVVLCTRAASESASYYFINNVIFFHVPTVPSTFIQMLGRITRKNTLFPNDLNCYIFRSENIDLYKLMVVSSKTFLMEVASGEVENNVPSDYKQSLPHNEAQNRYKRVLLWQRHR